MKRHSITKSHILIFLRTFTLSLSYFMIGYMYGINNALGPKVAMVFGWSTYDAGTKTQIILL